MYATDDKPYLFVVAGTAGAGKTTLIETLRPDVDFPQHLLVQHEQEGWLAEADDALLWKESLTIETDLAEPDVIGIMQKATEKGFEVELLIVGVEAADIAADRYRRKRRRRLSDELLARQFDQTLQHLPPATDHAKRVMIIDNTLSTPTFAQLAPGAEMEANSGPAWVFRKIIQPKIERAASKQLMHAAINKLSGSSQIQPFLQAASIYQPGSYEGKIVERTQHHALQQIGHALHIVHDLALLPQAGISLGLAKDMIASIAYQANRENSFAREKSPNQDRGLSR